MASQWVLGRLTEGVERNQKSRVTGCCQYGDEPSNSGSSELVRYLVSQAIRTISVTGLCQL
jgi:hypothetical protein